ncbi:FAD:protein FMN transferase [Lysobacter sp. A378]
MLGWLLWPLAAIAMPLQTLAGQTMGTTWAVTLQAEPGGLPALRRGIQAELDRVVAQMSTWEADSELSRFNNAVAGASVVLPPQLHEVVDAALELAAETQGAFDPTVGPLVNLWGFGPGNSRPGNDRQHPPAPKALAAARKRVGWRQLSVNADGTATQPGGVYVDLSGIAKGYGVDQVARFLLGQKVEAFLVEVGGELRGHGRKADGSDWRIAVERPAPDDTVDNDIQQVVALDGLAMATSGDYRRYFDDAGRRYSHTIDPRTGFPVTHGLASVTVLHENCMQADALATALTVLGPEQGWDYAQRHGLAVLLTWHEGNGFASRMTPAFASHVQSQ